jgi:hypothetical protein
MLGCGMAALVLLILVCSLLTFGILSVARRVHGQSPSDAVSPQLLILVDQSGSVANLVTAQRLARDCTATTITAWRRINPAASARVDFFGSETRPALGPKPVADLDWPTILRPRFAQPQDLGATEFHRALQSVLNETTPISDVVIITDGMPDPIGNSDAAGQQAYGDLLHQLSLRLAERGTRLSIILVGDSGRDAWDAVWRSLVSHRNGIVAEVRNTAQLPMLDTAWSALPAYPVSQPQPPTSSPTPSVTSTVTPMPPTPQPSATTRTPVHTPATQVQAVLNPTAPPAITRQPTSPSPAPSPLPTLPERPDQPSSQPNLWLIGSLAALGMLVSFGVVAIGLRTRTRVRHTAFQPRQLGVADAGWIEIHGEDDEPLQRLELRAFVLGEVVNLGYAPNSDVRLPSVAAIEAQEAGLVNADVIEPDGEQAVLILTPQGPLIEARGGKLHHEGQAVRQHLLFDGDTLELNRCQLYYHNFFRQRPVETVDAEADTPA